MLQLLESTRDYEEDSQVTQVEALKLAALSNLAAAALAQGEGARAVEWCDKGLDLSPDNAKVSRGGGACHLGTRSPIYPCTRARKCSGIDCTFESAILYTPAIVRYGTLLQSTGPADVHDAHTTHQSQGAHGSHDWELNKVDCWLGSTPTPTTHQPYGPVTDKEPCIDVVECSRALGAVRTTSAFTKPRSW
jgi:hypothetical protein